MGATVVEVDLLEGVGTDGGFEMIWLVLALVVAFAILQSIVIERLFRDQRRALNDLDAMEEQFDALAVVVDRQVLSQSQLQDQARPVAEAIRESNKVVAETVESLLGSIREAKAERRKLSTLIAQGREVEELTNSSDVEPAQPVPAVNGRRSTTEPIAWPETERPPDVTPVVRVERRGRGNVVVTERPAPKIAETKKAIG